MKKNIKLITTAILLCCRVAVFSQETVKTAYLKNEVGIDVANIITLLAKKNESYLVNYKHHFTERHGLRAGLDLDISTFKDNYKNFRIKAGYEYDYPVLDRWKLYGGADMSFYHNANNFQPNTTIRYGLSPLLGVSFFIGKRFSISTEVSLNCFFIDHRKPGSFDPDDNYTAWDFNIGSVGMLVVSYHF